MPLFDIVHRDVLESDEDQDEEDEEEEDDGEDGEIPGVRSIDFP